MLCLRALVFLFVFLFVFLLLVFLFFLLFFATDSMCQSRVQCWVDPLILKH